MESNLTPAQNDIALAEIYNKIATQSSIIERNEIIVNADRYYSDGEKAKAAQKCREAVAEVLNLRAEAAPYQARYTRERWSRFYLVTNGNGHVHKDRACSTCYISTQYAWLPECSGMTEDEIVAEFGERVCTICYPTAPVIPGLVGRRDREAQEQKQSEKAAKQAAKLEKALLPDGQPLKLYGYSGSPTTLIAARRALSHEMENLEWYSETHPSAKDWKLNVELLSEAIARKTGEIKSEILNTTQAKVAKKVAREKAA